MEMELCSGLWLFDSNKKKSTCNYSKACGITAYPGIVPNFRA